MSVPFEGEGGMENMTFIRRVNPVMKVRIRKGVGVPGILMR